MVENGCIIVKCLRMPDAFSRRKIELILARVKKTIGHSKKTQQEKKKQKMPKISFLNENVQWLLQNYKKIIYLSLFFGNQTQRVKKNIEKKKLFLAAHFSFIFFALSHSSLNFSDTFVTVHTLNHKKYFYRR